MLAGGAISEKLGGSYELGAGISGIVGGAAYGKISEMKKIKKISALTTPLCARVMIYHKAYFFS